MTVKELTEILSKHDPGLTALVDGYEYGFCDIDAGNIYLMRYDRDVNSAYYAGPHDEDSEGKYEGLVIGRKPSWQRE